MVYSTKSLGKIGIHGINLTENTHLLQYVVYEINKIRSGGTARAKAMLSWVYQMSYSRLERATYKLLKQFRDGW